MLRCPTARRSDDRPDHLEPKVPNLNAAICTPFEPGGASHKIESAFWRSVCPNVTAAALPIPPRRAYRNGFVPKTDVRVTPGARADVLKCVIGGPTLRPHNTPLFAVSLGIDCISQRSAASIAGHHRRLDSRVGEFSHTIGRTAIFGHKKTLCAFSHRRTHFFYDILLWY